MKTTAMDSFTTDLLDDLFRAGAPTETLPQAVSAEIKKVLADVEETKLTGPILDLFKRLTMVKNEFDYTPGRIGDIPRSSGKNRRTS